MAKKSMEMKCKKLQIKAQRMHELGLKMKFSTKVYNRCSVCGRPRGYIGKFQMCRICIRERANNGELMGVKKSSW